MAPGFVVTSEAADDVRVVTFANGFVAGERLVSRDEHSCRIAYSLTGDAGPVHDNAVMEVIAAGPQRCRFLWSHDVLPDEAASPLRAAMQEAAPIIKCALENSTVGWGDTPWRIFINWTDQGQLNRWPRFRCPVSTCVTVC